MTINPNRMDYTHKNLAYAYVEELLDAIDVLNAAIDDLEKFGADGINKECAMNRDEDIREIDAHLNTALTDLESASYVVENIMNNLQ